MQKKKAISLIVLVITIIIMIILASAIILSLDNANIFNKAEEAVDKTNAATNKYLSEIKLAERELEKIQGPSKVTDTNPGQLRQEDDTYYIESIDDLVAFSELVNSGERNFEGKTVKLTRLLDFNSDNSYVDKSLKQPLIDPTGVGFTPIGTYDNPFKGTFDGDGTEIRNIYINSTEDYVGLFGVVSDANIYNLGVTGKVISSGERVAGMIGYLNNTKQTKIANCYSKVNVEANVDDTYDYGGIVGSVNSSVSEDFCLILADCYNTGNVIGKQYVGGIVGYVEVDDKLKIDRCYNVGKITGTYIAGGIVGDTYESVITNVYNAGEIYASDAFGGGIGGGIAWGTLENAYNVGRINPSKDSYESGGIIGNSVGSNIMNCYNIGDMSINSKLGELIGNTWGADDDNNVSYLYYLKNRNAMVADEGNAAIIDTTPTGITLNKSLEEMKSQSFVEELNNNIQGRDDLVKWKMGPKGYPTLDI